MKKNAKKVDIIIIAVILLIIAAVILAVLVKPEEKEQSINAPVGSASEVKYTDYNGKKIGILTGASFEPITFEAFPDSEYFYYNSYSDLNTSLSQGHIDGFVGDMPTLKNIHDEMPEIGYLSEPITSEDYYFLFNKNDTRTALICGEFNEFLGKLRDNGTLKTMKDIWFGSDESVKIIDESGITGENGSVKIVTCSSMPPFCYVKDGKISGLCIDLAVRFCREYRYSYEIEDADVTPLLAGITSGKYDFSASPASMTEERRQSMLYSDSFYSAGTGLAVRSSDISSDASGGMVEDRPFSYYADNKKIGVITGGLYEVMIRERYPNADLYQYNNQADLGAALDAGLIDCFTVPRSTAEDFKKQYDGFTYLNEVFTQIPYGFAFEKSADKEYLRDQMNEFMKKIQSDGTYDEIVSVWFGDDEDKKIVDDTGLNGENGALKMVTTATMQPFSYIKEGKNVGLEIDLVTRFCREYGYSLDIDSAEFASLIPGITSGMYNIAAGNIMITAERAESVNFSDVYYTADAVAVVRSETETEEAAPGFFDSIAQSFEKNFIREERWKMILDGIGTTCLITVMSTLAGTVLAFLICMFRRTGSRLANAISNIYVKLLQGTPMVVLLMILYYVVFGKSGLDAVWVAIIGFSLNVGAYVSEIMRSGIESIDGGQREAALALGYSENQAFFRFIFPQAAVRFLPVYRGEIVSLLKSTSIVGYIAIQDLTKMSDIIRSRTYEAFFPLIATAIIYFILAWIISIILKFVLKTVSPKRKRDTVK